MNQAQSFDRSVGEADSRAPGRRRALRAGIIVLVVLAVPYGGRVAWLSVMATEGDVPPASAIPLPAGTDILGESIDCGSGGCSLTLTVSPPGKQSPQSLAEELGATPQTTYPGSFWDPRTVWVSARPSGGALILVVDYWSSEWIP